MITTKATWYWRRLQKMSAGEVTWRLGDEVRRRAWTRRQVAPNGDSRERRWESEAAASRWLQRRPSFDAALPSSAIRAISPSGRAELKRAADEIFSGRWTALGTTRLDMKDPDWFFDPLNGLRAPQSDYCFRIDHRSEQVTGNIKQVWELSRMQPTTVLAGAFAVSGETRYAELAADHLRSWWQENPFLSGVHWTSGIELGVRLISWVWIRRLLDGWPEVSTLFERNPKALQQIWWHQDYLASFSSRGSSANNHLVAESAGQLVASLAFPWFEESPAWAAHSARSLEQSLAANTFTSGLNREMATHYHGFVAELGLLAGVEADRAGRPLSDHTWELLCRMYDAAAAVVDIAVRPPRQGDADDGRSLVLGRQDDNYWEALLALGAAVFGSTTWWPSCKSTVASVLVRSLAGDHSNLHRPAQRPFHFPDAGLTILREESADRPEIWCRCDAGPHGFLSIAAHAHADALSVEIRHDGIDILADPGTYCYHGEPEWREYFRSTLAHNTVEINGRAQSVSGGPFLWTRHAETRLIELCEAADDTVTWSAEHDGYATLDPPAGHRRTVTFAGAARRVTITDEITAAGQSTVRLAFHLGPGVRADLRKATAELCWTARDGSTASATLRLPRAMTWSALHGSTEPIIGWYSASLGEKEPSTTLLGEITCSGSSRFESILQFSD